LAKISEIALGPDQRVVSFEFSALNYERAREIVYRYRMKGFDSDWVKTSSERRLATYSNLPAGSYVFEVEAQFSDGSAAAKALEISIRVMPPFYETW